MKKEETTSIWIGEQDLTENQDFASQSQEEFINLPIAEQLGNEEVAASLGGNRRDFLKFLGFGLGAATVAAGCDIPVKRAIPYVIKPDEIVPGVANYYASSYVKGGDYCSLLVKTREGRPIKIEGNSMSPITKGGTSARAQASVLDLYDTYRLTGPKKDNADITWSTLDSEVGNALQSASNIRILSNTIISPTAKKAIEEFRVKFPSARHIQYDAVSYSGMLDANESSFGVRAIPGYHFDKADVIVSFGADFLGTWLSPVEFAKQYITKRKIKDVHAPAMSRHIQVETGMSLTGSNADNRILVKPSEQGSAIAYLYGKIAGQSAGSELNDKAKGGLDKVAAELRSAAGKSLVVSNSNNPAEQTLVNAINNILGNYGSTIDWGSASMQKQGSDADLNGLIQDMSRGSVDALILIEANPAYDCGQSAAFISGLEKVGTTVACTLTPSETTEKCTYLAPIPHFLESWGDAEPKAGHYSLIQPTIPPLFNTRQYEESLLTWAGSPALNKDSDQPYFDYLMSHWEETLFAQQSEFATFQGFRDHCLAIGVHNHHSDAGSTPAFNGNTSAALGAVTKPGNGEIEIAFFESVGLENGVSATNPWLMEMPDPVTRTSWGNYLAIPVSFDGQRKMVGLNGLKDGDLVDLTIGDQTVTIPVIQQFGQTPGTVSLALGYGRTKAGKCGSYVGVDVNQFLTMNNGNRQYFNSNVAVSGKKGEEKHYSSVQYHHTFGVKGVDSKTGETINADEAAAISVTYGIANQGYQGFLTDRSIIYNTNVENLEKDLEHMHEKRHEAQHLNDQQIYRGYDAMYDQGHHWGMHVDLNSCIGCGACTVACMAENNVPVVGKEEVSRHHEMTWLRIDRYYYGDVDNPNVVYQPMMCQHCDNAPCENVCPVNATNHSSEGLNQMTYNRCVGTRYCANNCPFKVRRFNWMDYTTADIFPANQVPINGEEIPFGADNLTRMVLNPDVTVRVRGVIEKCSFCVQRIQEGKLTAKVEGRRLVDSDVRTACQTACPTGAITFGDMNNKKGQLAEKLESPLNYIVLEETNVRSSVQYTMKVNNRDVSLDA
jgi:molybdopterin-containing oxidoreductase family iron-sulfur binding subunit